MIQVSIVPSEETRVQIESFRGPAGRDGPAGPAGAPGQQGEAGEDGYSPSVELTRLNYGVRIDVTDKNGTQSEVVYDGTGGGGTGGTGEDGGYYTPSVSTDGVLSWEASKAGMPEVEAVSIKGPKGDTGATGAQGPKGDTGPAGAQGPAGADGAKGDTGDAGPQGPAGATGPKGDTGAAGYSPVRGKDYWTDADVAQIKAYVDDAILNGSW